VLEPFQTQKSVQGQVDELRSQIDLSCIPPVVIIGWSWGAWLGGLFAAQNPERLKKLILVGSGPFEAQYAHGIKDIRTSRLTAKEQAERASLRPESGDPRQIARLVELYDITDTYQRDASPIPRVDFDPSINVPVWREASAMRENGSLLDMLARIRCPVLAIHGDHDPHPAAGVSEPLRAALPHATFKLLDRCGHKPWQEVHAKDLFYRHLERSIG
jgi:pimeloyl-ACP methyl ester carboxylesterase